MQAMLITGLFCMLCSGPLHADFDEKRLKKLFTDKQQRARIDAIRLGKTGNTGELQTNKISVRGYMTRSDGKSVVWLNNKNTMESSKIGGVKVHQNRTGKNKKIVISADGKTARLKPGESWHKDTGKIVDNP